jgi:hypothetical protein
MVEFSRRLNRPAFASLTGQVSVLSALRREALYPPRAAA